VLVHLNFTGYDVEDSQTNIRLVDSNGSEVPSVVLGAQYSGIFLRSAYLLFLTNIPPGSSEVYYVYYGSAFQSAPSYRSLGPAPSISTSGFVSMSQLPLSSDSTQIQIGFGTIDSETTMSGVSYTAGGGTVEFGPSDFSQSPFTNDTGVTLAGQLNSQTTVASEDLQAGLLQLTRILVLSPKSALVIDALADGGTGGVSGVTLTSVVGLEGLSTLGYSSSTYNQGAGVLLTQSPDGYFAVQQSPGAASFDLGTMADVLAEAMAGQFSGASSYAPASAAGFTWKLGDLQPSGSIWVSSSWGVAFTASQIPASLPPIPVGAVIGGQEVQAIATPSARSVWSAEVSLANVFVPSSGLAIPFGIGGGDLLPGASSMSGTYTYTVPSSAQSNPSSWTSAATTTGNATAYAAPQYYAFDLGTTVERLSGDVPNPTSSATASLISSPGFAFRGSGAVLQVEYKASYSVNTGNLSSQDLFVAADLDPTLTGNYSQSVVLPLTGSSTSVPVSGCTPLGPSGSQVEQINPAGFLIGDNTWRTLSVNLPSSLPASGFNVVLRLCLSTSQGFSGGMNLEIASVGVVLTGPASNFLQSTFSQVGPDLTIGYLPQASSIASVGITANLTVSLVFQLPASIGWQDGSTFNGTVTAPSAFTVNYSAIGQTVVPGEPRFEGVIISSAVSQYASSARINGANGTLSVGPGITMLTNSSSTSLAPGNSFTMGLQSQAVFVSVLDQNRAGVPGVQVVPWVEGQRVPVATLTNDSGVAEFQLVPWTYQFNATYQGEPVGSGGIQAGSPPSASILAGLYNLTLLVKDSRGGIIPGAQLSLSVGNYSFSGVTGPQGEFSFEGIENAEYSITVTVASSTYFSGQVSATANNAIIEVTTSYLPQSTQLLIVSLVALVPVAVVAAYYLTRRLRKAT
jgi:hypothetical protein